MRYLLITRIRSLKGWLFIDFERFKEPFIQIDILQYGQVKHPLEQRLPPRVLDPARMHQR